MLCEKCKIREANVQILEIVNGQKTEHFFCAQCAAEMDLNVHSPQGDIPLAKLLSNLLSQTVKSQQKEKPANVVCPTCGTTYEQFINDSKLGCADCYKVFDLLIGENIKQLQGSDRHQGKRPKYISGEIPEQVKEDIEESITSQGPGGELLDKLLEVRKKLREAVAAEEFEQAAGLRDELRAIEVEVAQAALGTGADEATEKTKKKSVKTEKTVKSATSEKTAKTVKSETSEKPAKTVKSETSEKPAKTVKSATSEKSAKTVKPAKTRKLQDEESGVGAHED